MSVVAIILVAVLLILCCCCLVVGGGAALSVALSPTPTFTPTRVPQRTAGPIVSPRPTSTPRSLRTPTSGPSEMKTYSSTAHGFSIQYPADWKVEEGKNGPSFSRLGTASAGVVIGVFPGSNAVGDRKALMDMYVSKMQNSTEFAGLVVASEDTRVFNGVEWQYLIVLYTMSSGTNTKWDLYGTIHTNGVGYIFTGVTGTATYEKDTLIFTQMMESFRFLP